MQRERISSMSRLGERIGKALGVPTNNDIQKILARAAQAQVEVPTHDKAVDEQIRAKRDEALAKTTNPRLQEAIVRATANSEQAIAAIRAKRGSK
jgi:hypothetical protein